MCTYHILLPDIHFIFSLYNLKFFLKNYIQFLSCESGIGYCGNGKLPYF